MGKDRVQRIWRREGLKVPAKHRPRGRLWMNDGSCIRLRPQHRNHVWSYDFVEARTHDGRSLRLLVMIDEFTRECLAIQVARRLNSAHVIEVLGDCMLTYGVPEHVAPLVGRRVGEAGGAQQRLAHDADGATALPHPAADVATVAPETWTKLNIFWLQVAPPLVEA